MEEKKTFCTRCGKQVEAAEKFCSDCGNVVNKKRTSGVPLNEETVTKGDTSTNQYSGYKKRKPNNLILLVGTAVIAIALYLVFFNTEFREISGNWIPSDFDNEESVNIAIEKNGKAKITVSYIDGDSPLNNGEISIDIQLEKLSKEASIYRVNDIQSVQFAMDNTLYELFESEVLKAFDDEGVSDIETKKSGKKMIVTFNSPREWLNYTGEDFDFVINAINENTLVIDDEYFYRQ